MLRDGTDLPRYERLLGNPRHFFGVNSPVKLVKAIASFSVVAWYFDQIVLMSEGKPNDPDMACFRRFLALQRRQAASPAVDHRRVQGYRNAARPTLSRQT